ncbi:MAG TPA: bifunctional DNA primase/polymerase, partial [Burkholderiales bacterium]|nr:bifunctional DNA primase/polymerase [Burkholderiales bacterium]
MNARTDPRLAQALLLAEMGRAVVALEGFSRGACTCRNARCATPGAHPIADEKPTNYLRHVHSIWTRRPDANVGLALGTVSGIFALQVDAKAGGHESVLRLEEAYGGLPVTLTAARDGNEWRVFKLPNGVTLNGSLGNAFPGLSILGDGKWIVVEPSIGPSATSWLDC